MALQMTQETQYGEAWMALQMSQEPQFGEAWMVLQMTQGCARSDEISSELTKYWSLGAIEF